MTCSLAAVTRVTLDTACRRLSRRLSSNSSLSNSIQQQPYGTSSQLFIFSISLLLLSSYRRKVRTSMSQSGHRVVAAALANLGPIKSQSKARCARVYHTGCISELSGRCAVFDAPLSCISACSSALHPQLHLVSNRRDVAPSCIDELMSALKLMMHL